MTHMRPKLNPLSTPKKGSREGAVAGTPWSISKPASIPAYTKRYKSKSQPITQQIWPSKPSSSQHIDHQILR
jgi:hypothetical protein